MKTLRHVHDARSECQVINEQLIRDGIRVNVSRVLSIVLDGAMHVQIDDESTSLEEKRQTMAFGDIEMLSLSFRNVIAIEYLHGLHALKKLQLDNNQLSAIQNLDALVPWPLRNASHVTSRRRLGES